MTAAQAELSSLYGEGKPATDLSTKAATINATADVSSDKLESVKVGTKEEYKENTALNKQHAAYTINWVEYKENGVTLYYDGTSWSQDKAECKGDTTDVYPESQDSQDSGDGASEG